MAVYSFLVIVYSLLHNFQEPKFETQTLDENVSIGYGLAIGDVNGDGKPDILLADKKEFVWYRNGDWKRFVMVANLTEADNVCIAARDIDGDGKVEVAVGAQWNPGETSDIKKSGSVHFLQRPKDPTQPWTPVELYHEPTVHRMRWVKAQDKTYHLIVVPLHGVGNKDGQGVPVNVIAYEKPKDINGNWKHTVIENSMHMTHNLDVVNDGNREKIYIGGKEGVRTLSYEKGKWTLFKTTYPTPAESFGEIRVGQKDHTLVAGIQPMHGNELVVYLNGKRNVLTGDLKQGHALAAADLLGMGSDQIVAGWREANTEGTFGIKIFVRSKDQQWIGYWIDNNGMACEDLQVADLNGDNKPEIIAAGRATNNLKIYWNKN